MHLCICKMLHAMMTVCGNLSLYSNAILYVYYTAIQ